MGSKAIFTTIFAVFFVSVQSTFSQCWKDTGFTLNPSQLEIEKMIFVDENSGWLLITDTLVNPFSGNYSHSLFRTINGGVSWQEITPLPYIDFESISFVSQTVGWATGRTSGQVKLYKTTNGGLSWSPSNFPVLHSYNVYFFDNNFGWCGGTGNKIYYTINGGNTWTLSLDNLIEVYAMKIKFFDANYGWILHYNNFGATMWRTINGGQNWVNLGEVNGELISDFSFSSQNFGITSGNGYIISKTTDGGLTWQDIPYSDPSTAGIFCFDSNSFWIGGLNGIAKTSDGGITWKNYPIDNGNDRISDIVFFNTNSGFARSESKVFRYKPQIPNCISNFTFPLSLSNVPVNTTFLWAATNDCITGNGVTLKKEDGTPLANFVIDNVNSLNLSPYIENGMSYQISIQPYNDYGGALQCSEFQFTTECQSSISVTSTQPTCNANNGSIAINNVSGIFGNYQIQWSNGITNTPIIQNLSPGNYQVTVSNSICSATKEVILTNSGFQPTAIIQTPIVISCTNSTIQLDASSSQNATLFNWTATNGGNILSGASTPTPTINSPGNYTLTVFSAGGCSSSTSVIVTSDNSNPIINLNSNNVLTCANNVVMLDASSSTNAVNFLWTTTNGNIVSGANTSTPLVNTSGLYTLQVTAANGCTAITSTIVTQNLSSPTISIQGNNLSCTNPTTQLFVNTSAQNPLYQWSGVNGFLSNLSSPIVSNAGYYYLTITDSSNGCTNTSSIQLLQDGNFPGALVTGGELNCNNLSITLNVNSSGTGLTYLWSGSGINGANQQLMSPVVSVPGLYSVTVTNPTNGCSSIGQTIINGNYSPPVANAGNNYNLQCGTGITLDGSASGNATSFIWLNANGTTIGSVSMQNVNEPGVYSLIVIGTNGCRDTTQVTVQGNSYPTNASVTITDVTCKGLQNGTLQIQSVNGGSLPFQYSLNNGVFQTENLFENLAPGVYTIRIKDVNECAFEVENNLITEPLEFLEVKISVPTSGAVSINTEIEMHITTNEDTSDFLYNWSGSGLSCINCPNPKTTLSSTSIYRVTVTNSAGCSASASEFIYVKSENSDESHVITPGNQNGENDVLIFPQLSNNSYPLSELVIFNRWGSTIYTAKPYQNNWRGTNQNGYDMPQGTYFFILHLDKSANKLIKGDVLIIR